MRLIFTSFLLCIVTLLSAQSVQQKRTDSITQVIKGLYNKKDAAGIYAFAGEKFRQALTEQAFASSIETTRTQVGQMLSCKPETFENNIGKYAAIFVNTTLSLYVGLDAAQKLETFRLNEYERPVAKTNAPIPTSNPLQTGLDKKLDSLVRAFMKANNTVGLVAGVLENGKKQVYGYGEFRRGSNSIPDGNTLFEIGSISKTFTATLLAHFVQQGKIKLDDPVNKYLPDSVAKLEFNGKPVTVESLSNHSSGLPRLPGDMFTGGTMGNPYEHYDNAKLFAWLKQYKPTREPGEQYEYSNLTFGMLGVILERISGKSYEQLLNDIIWKPLKMANTRVALKKQDSAVFAQGYNQRGAPVRPWDFQSLAACGAIRSGVNDMLRYAEAQVASTGGGSSLQNAIALTHKQTFEKGQTVVALGWHIVATQRSSFAHAGGTGGYACIMVFDEKSKRAVIMLTNGNDMPPAEPAQSLLNWLDKR